MIKNTFRSSMYFCVWGMAITAFADDTLPIYGSRIWFDLNGNGIQDQNEPSAPAIHFDKLALQIRI